MDNSFVNFFESMFVVEMCGVDFDRNLFTTDNYQGCNGGSNELVMPTFFQSSHPDHFFLKSPHRFIQPLLEYRQLRMQGLTSSKGLMS